MDRTIVLIHGSLEHVHAERRERIVGPEFQGLYSVSPATGLRDDEGVAIARFPTSSALEQTGDSDQLWPALLVATLPVRLIRSCDQDAPKEGIVCACLPSVMVEEASYVAARNLW